MEEDSGGHESEDSASSMSSTTWAAGKNSSLVAPTGPRARSKIQAFQPGEPTPRIGAQQPKSRSAGRPNKSPAPSRPEKSAGRSNRSPAPKRRTQSSPSARSPKSPFTPKDVQEYFKTSVSGLGSRLTPFSPEDTRQYMEETLLARPLRPEEVRSPTGPLTPEDVTEYLASHASKGNQVATSSAAPPFSAEDAQPTRRAAAVALAQGDLHVQTSSDTPPPAGKARPSFLDRLQKDAHASELDYTNTSPSSFLLLSLVQLPIAFALSRLAAPAAPTLTPFAALPWLRLNRFGMQALLNIGCHWAGFTVAMLIGSAKFFDITEDFTYLANIHYSYRTIAPPSRFFPWPSGPATPSPRQTLVYGCAALWCLRLVAFVGYRVLVRGSDFRFDKLNRAKAYQFFGWTSGGTWCWANGFCLWHVAEASQAAPLRLLDWIGLGLFAFGLLFELIADLQKYAFNQAYASGQNKKWIETGLWSLSRHPNYFGETTLWLGLALISMSGEFTWRSVSTCLVSPLFSFVFLLFTSLMLLEKRADRTWGRNPDYQAYKARTPVWLPSLRVS